MKLSCCRWWGNELKQRFCFIELLPQGDIDKPRANGRSTVGQQFPDVTFCIRLHNLQSATQPLGALRDDPKNGGVADYTTCCMLLGVVGRCCAKFETVQTFSYVQTDATTLDTSIVGPTMLRVVASVYDTFSSVPHPQLRWLICLINSIDKTKSL